MNHEKLPSRRDLLKFGAGAVVGAAGAGLAQNLSRTKERISGPDVDYENVSDIVRFQRDARVVDKLKALGKQIVFNNVTGSLRVLDEDGAEIEKLPGNREIAAVFVSSDFSSVRFEYRGREGTRFGVNVERSIENGDIVTSSWESD